MKYKNYFVNKGCVTRNLKLFFKCTKFLQKGWSPRRQDGRIWHSGGVEVGIHAGWIRVILFPSQRRDCMYESCLINSWNFAINELIPNINVGNVSFVFIYPIYRISSIFSITLNIRSPSIFSKIIIFCASKIRSQDFK